MDTQEKTYNKWNSRRWLVTIWSLLTLSFLIGFSLITKYSPDWLGIAIPLLVAIPNVYIGTESWTKINYMKNNSQKEDAQV